MLIEKGDVLLHKNTGDVYAVRSSDKSAYGRSPLVNLYHYKTKEIHKFDPSVLDQFFTKVPDDLVSDVAEMGRVGPGDYEHLKAVRTEYQEYLASHGGQPPRHDTPYTSAETQSILQNADNTIALYQLAMELERTVTGVRYVLDKARSLDATKWKTWQELGVPGDSSYWLVQSVVKDMGGTYNPLLDSRPDLYIHR